MRSVDTARVLVDWECNLKCSYCCNEQVNIRSAIQQVLTLDEIHWRRYQTVCISGGEPLLFMERILAEAARAHEVKATTVLYTNGLLLNQKRTGELALMGIDAINVGLHIPEHFSTIIRRVSSFLDGMPFSVRFHVWERYRTRALEEEFPGVEFRWWTMDACDRPNEDRFVWTPDPATKWFASTGRWLR